MLLNISSDRIIYSDANSRRVLPYGDLEKTIAEFLYTELGSVKNAGASGQIIVINGPGSFTNLRIVTLALNAFSLLNGKRLQFYSIDKVTRYTTLYRLGKVPRYCLMYIGQKNNFWLVDLQRSSEISLVEYIKEVKKIHSSVLREEIALVEGNVFLDEVVAEGLEMISEKLDGIGQLEMSEFVYADDLVERFGLALSDTIEPAYMINANIQL